MLQTTIRRPSANADIEAQIKALEDEEKQLIDAVSELTISVIDEMRAAFSKWSGSMYILDVDAIENLYSDTFGSIEALGDKLDKAQELTNQRLEIMNKVEQLQEQLPDE